MARRTPEERRVARRRRNPWIVAEARRINAAPRYVPPGDPTDVRRCEIPIVARLFGSDVRQPCGVYVQGGLAALHEHERVCHPGWRS